MFGREVEGVEVAGGGMAEQDRRVVLLPLQRGRGKWGGVASQDLLEQLGSGADVDVVGSQDCVWVSVADYRKVEVVGGAAAGQHGVELLPRLMAGGEAVHGVDGEALSAVHCGGIAELGGTADVVSWQGHPAAVLCMLHLQSAGAGDIQDGPAVTVFDPVGGGDAEPPFVSTGDDHIASGCTISVGQFDVSVGPGVVEALDTGSRVEPDDQITGGRQHDRVEATVAVCLPCGEQLLDRCGGVADVDAAAVKVEAERFGSAVPQGERGSGLGWVVESAYFGETVGAADGLDIAQHTPAPIAASC